MTRLATPAGSPGAQILGLGDYRPARVVDNHEISRRVDTSDEWIRTRTGIVTRRIAGPDETVLEMAAIASGKALAAAGLRADEIDLIVLATCTERDRLPSVSARLGTRLGADRPGAVDINAACAGFSYALASASDAVRTGNARHVLVVGVERLSEFTDWDDRSTCIIFADGAGAAVVGPADEPAIGPVVWGSDGDKADAITITAEAGVLAMDGQAVFRWTTTALAPVARAACERAGLTPADLRVVVPHQANVRIIDSLVRSLGIPDAVVSRDIAESGNTSAASIPLGLTRLVETGAARSGDPTLLIGFGSGLTYAAQVILCP